MKYVLREPAGVFDLTKYEDYLERERSALASHIQGADLLTIDRFVPAGPGSFHDSRFESLLVAASVTEHAGVATQNLKAELRLKGPYFDRYFELLYEDVSSCSFEAPAPGDDLLMHEIRMEHGVVAHELQFDKGKIITIMCREIRFVESSETAGVANVHVRARD